MIPESSTPGEQMNEQPSDAIGATRCPEDCPMCLGLECLLCGDGTVECAHGTAQRHRKLSTLAAQHQMRVQECLDEYESADMALRTAVKEASRSGFDVLDELGIAPDHENTRQLIAHEMDVA